MVVALVLCVSAIGCASTGARGGGDNPAVQTDGASGAGSEGQSNGAPGAPGAAGNGGGGAEAIGAPIKMPAFTQIGGGLVDDVKQEIEAAIRERCKPRHDLCVTTVVKPREGSDTHACFAGTDPATTTAGTELPQRTVLTIYSGPGPCKPPDSGVDQQTTDSSAPTETSQPPADQTTPPDDSQPPPSSP